MAYYMHSTSRFGFFVGLDLSEACTTSLYNIDNVHSFSIYIGNNMPQAAYNVILPSKPFTESAGLFINLLGMVQRTNPAVQPQVVCYEQIQTMDVVVCSLVQYILCVVYMREFHDAIVDSSVLAAKQYRWCLPYAVNCLNDIEVCKSLVYRRRAGCSVRHVLYVSTVRSNYATDIVTRSNLLFNL